MKRWLKAFGRSPDDYRLWAETLAWLVVVRLGLWTISFRRLRRTLDNQVAGNLKVAARYRKSSAEVARTVRRLSRLVPAATCLTQALVARVMLSRAAYPSVLHIGVAKAANGKLEAHAWVECENVIVTGKVHDLARYTVLSNPDFENAKDEARELLSQG